MLLAVLPGVGSVCFGDDGVDSGARGRCGCCGSSNSSVTRQSERSNERWGSKAVYLSLRVFLRSQNKKKEKIKLFFSCKPDRCRKKIPGSEKRSSDELTFPDFELVYRPGCVSFVFTSISTIA